MYNKEMQYGVLGLLIGGVAIWILMTTIGTRTTGGVMNFSQSPMTGNFDAHFIEQMIPHHEDAITMANLAATKANHPEIKQLAESIITSQGSEISQMKNWYKNWFGRELPTGDQVMQHHGMMSGSGMHMGMMGNQADIERLNQAADFDKAFIEHMIPHHQMAVMMASMLKNGTQRPEMQKLADDIITAQTKEIDQMREWYEAWF